MFFVRAIDCDKKTNFLQVLLNFKTFISEFVTSHEIIQSYIFWLSICCKPDCILLQSEFTFHQTLWYLRVQGSKRIWLLIIRSIFCERRSPNIKCNSFFNCVAFPTPCIWLQSANWLQIHTSVTYKSLRYMTPILYEWVASYKMKSISYFPFRFEFVAIPTLCKWLQSANWLHIKGDILHGVHLYMIYLRVPVLRKSISNYLYF